MICQLILVKGFSFIKKLKIPKTIRIPATSNLMESWDPFVEKSHQPTMIVTVPDSINIKIVLFFSIRHNVK